MSSTLSSTSVSSSVRRSTTLNPEETDLWELCYYAGVTIDPQVFRILVDLLHMDVHPKAVLDVLKNIAPHSKYAPKIEKSDKKDKLPKTDTSKKPSEIKQKASKSSLDVKSLSNTNHSRSARSNSSDRRNLSTGTGKTSGSKSQTSLSKTSLSIK